MISEADKKFILSPNSKSAIIWRRVYLLLLTFGAFLAGYFELELFYIYIAVMGFSLGALFKTWNGLRVHKILEELIEEIEAQRNRGVS